MNFKEIGREFGISVIVDVILDKMRKGVGMIAADTAEKIKKKLTDEKRAELLSFLRELAAYGENGKKASETLLRRQRDRQERKALAYDPRKKYLPGSEDEFVTLLTKLFIALSDDERELESRIATFIWLGEMEDLEFDAKLEFLKHDVVLQYGRRIPHVIREMWLEFKDLSKEFGLEKSLRKVDASVGGKMQQINDGLEKHWWVRSSHKKTGLPGIFGFLRRKRS